MNLPRGRTVVCPVCGQDRLPVTRTVEVTGGTQNPLLPVHYGPKARWWHRRRVCTWQVGVPLDDEA